MELSQLLEAIKTLPDEDKQRALQALSQADDAQSEAQQVECADVETQTETAEEDTEATTEDSAEGEPIIQAAEGEQEQVEEDGQTEEELEDGEEVTDEPIPDMVNPAAPQGAQAQEAPMMDEQGAEMPLDYQQIIDGLNAKTMALEAENKQLKAKVEGAFGLSSKPGMPVAVNRLYGDTSDIPTIRK